jgi:hypothetical protein
MRPSFGFARKYTVLTILLVGIIMASAVLVASQSDQANAQPASADALAAVQPTSPIRAAFYYPWFPEGWKQSGISPFTHYTPSAGLYDTASSQTIRKHIAAMQYGNIQAGIASWWGRGHHTDSDLAAILKATDGTGFKWSIYHEQEGQGNPTVTQLRADLTYIRDKYASDADYLKVDGKFVVFVYNANDSSCDVVNRWARAREGFNVYLVMKVFGGYRDCATQPDSWHQYGPASAADSQKGFSYAISPGFWHAQESKPRLARDLNRWKQNVRDMVASNAPWQLVTTFNEWGEGTPVESANEWKTSSGYGAYLDALHNNGQSGGSTPTPTATSTSTPRPSPTATRTTTATPSPTGTPSGGNPVMLLAAGDIASCSSSGDEATAAIVAGQPGLVLALGDNVYDDGTAAEYRDCYDPTWGAFKSRTKPIPGNHDYHTSGASAYYNYFGAAAGDPSKGYYSFDLGNNWQAIALNSNCSKIGGCGSTSAQYKWLVQELDKHAGKNVLAYWHHARYSSGGEHGSRTEMDRIWDLLVTKRVDLALVGHDHHYERFAPIGTNDQRDDANGLRQFVVGTGGKSLYGMGTILPTSQVRNNSADGVLQLALYSDRYEWKFLPEAGKTFTDSGSTRVH